MAASCTTSADDERVAAILAAADLEAADADAAGEATGTTDCSTELVDEYGFTVVLPECASDDASTVPPPFEPLDGALDDAVAAIPPGPFADAVAAGVETLREVCDDGWDSAAVATALGATAASVGDPALEGWVGSDAALTLAAHLRSAFVLLEGCAQVPGGDADLAPLHAIAAANDTLWAALGDPADTAASSEFWFHAHEIGAVRGLLSLDGSGRPPTTWIVGSSTSRSGFDPLVLTDAAESTVVNLGVAAAATPVLHRFVPDLLELDVARPRRVVIGVSTYEDFSLCDASIRNGARYEQVSRRRALVFGGGVGAPPLRIVAGDATSTSPIIRNVDLQQDAYGALSRVQEQSPETLARQLENHPPRFDDPQRCAAILDDLRAVIDLVQRAGIDDVVVVSMPLSERYADLHPDGRAAFDAVGADYERAVLDAGATWLDYSTLVPEEGFRDLTHVGPLGRRITTDQLIADLDW